MPADLYDDIETRVVAYLRACPGLNQVKTLETGVRESLYSADQPAKSFSAAELPAIQVTAANDAVESEPFTAGEMKYLVPVTLLAVVRASKRDQARREVRAIQWELEKWLNLARRSAGDLGVNALVTGRLQSSVAVAQDAMFAYGIGQVEATILKVVDL